MMPVEVAVRSLFSLQPRGNLDIDFLQTSSNSTELSLSATSGPEAADLAAAAEEDEAASFVFRSRALIAYFAFIWGMVSSRCTP